MGTTKTYGLGGGVAGTSEVDDNTDASVLIESADGKDYIEIDTTDGSELLILKAGGSADQQVEIDSAGKLNIGSTEDDISIGGSLGAKISFARAGGVAITAAHASGALYFQTGGSNNRMSIDQSSNVTHTLDDSSNGIFKVVDNKGSPVTYLTLTQDGACEMGHTGSTTTLEGSGTTIRGASWVRTRVNGNPVWSGEKSGSATFVQYNGGNVTNCNSIYGAATTHTANTSVGDHVLMYNHVFELAASGPSGAVTCDADFKHQTGVPTGQTSYTAISHVTIVNSNATHNYIFKYNMKSGNGSVAAFDSDATNLTDGTGYTCAPGKVAMFEIRTVRIGGTAITNQVHMIRCLGKS